MKKPEKQNVIGSNAEHDIAFIDVYPAEPMDAYIAHLEQAVREAQTVFECGSKWIDSLKSYQDPLLGNGIEEACENWEKAASPEQWPEDLRSFDFGKFREWLAKYQRAAV